MPTDRSDNPQVTVKSEPGTYKRLPSFRNPRDLNLSQFRELPPNPLNGGTRGKRVFVPNLNVQRKKNTEDKNEPSSTEGEKPPSNRGRPERGRGRGRKQPNFIQTTGVFSQGLAPSLKTSSSWGSRSTESASLPKPKLKPQGHNEYKGNKEEEEEVIKELLRDDFIDDPDLESDMSNVPVALPLRECKVDVKNEKSISKMESLETITNGVSIKKEEEVKKVKKEEDDPRRVGNETKPILLSSLRPLTVPELLSSSQDQNFVFFQLPNCVPKLNMNVSYIPPTKVGQKSSDDAQDNERNTLRTLPPGRIGTLQILKSGRARLVLGDVKLSVEPGTHSAFRQDLISVNLDGSTKTGNMINMGRITTRLIVTPEWESLLKNG